MKPISCPETWKPTLCNIPEERSFLAHSEGNLKSRKILTVSFKGFFSHCWPALSWDRYRNSSGWWGWWFPAFLILCLMYTTSKSLVMLPILNILLLKEVIFWPYCLISALFSQYFWAKGVNKFSSTSSRSYMRLIAIFLTVFNMEHNTKFGRNPLNSWEGETCI